MSFEFYKVMHLLGLFLSLGALAGRAYFAGNSTVISADPQKKVSGAVHGTGVLLVLVGGFGMLAKMGLMAALPGWVHAKLALWLLVAGLIALPYRKPSLAFGLWVALPILGALGAYIAIYKPF